jgi:glutathione S-transferase
VIVLHDYFRSSASYRVRIALNLKGLDYEQHPVSLVANEQQSAEYKALNPQGFVPMLEIDGERVTQSLAIFDRLDALVEGAAVRPLRSARPRPRPGAGADDRLRHPPAQQPARAALPQDRAWGAAGRRLTPGTVTG